MREIKFRGMAFKINKGLLTKERAGWVYGWYVADCGWPSIIGFGGSETDVDEDTVGQYTGLKDKNGKEIYEGDIVKHQYEKGVAVVKFGEGYQGEPTDGMYPYWGWYADGWFDRYAFDGDDVEVVGNIWENPDMVA